ncbi:MAG: hypothetical protein JWQ73_1722 [Variovorax sp.]|nr:hypothetical protein [Variovorax sp.]
MARSIDLPAPRRRLLLALPALALMGACAAPSWSRSPPLASTSTGGRWLQLEVVDRDTGEALPVYSAGGQRYAPGRPGARYGLRIRNLRHERVLVVMAVDGVNVLTGQTAGWQQNGYVLGPLESGQIDGWRKTDREIAAFEFTAQAQSYAARTGRPLDIGVIGLAVFRERAVAPPPMPSTPRQAPGRDERGQGAADIEPGERDAAASDRRERSAQPTPAPQVQNEAKAASGAISADSSTARLGTGHGRREESVVDHTRFDRASSAPDEIIAVRYDSRANLVRLGVIPADTDAPDSPRPFPANPRDPRYGYVPDPPRW